MYPLLPPTITGPPLPRPRTHSDIGLLLTQFPSGRKVREPQGEKVSATELFNDLFTHLQNAAERRRLKAAVENLFVGKYREQPPCNQIEKQLDQKLSAGTSKERPLSIS